MSKERERWFPGKILDNVMSSRRLRPKRVEPEEDADLEKDDVEKVVDAALGVDIDEVLGNDENEPLIEIKQKTDEPLSGRSFEGQSNESYCVECIEGHTMLALTEMRHALDRYRSAGQMTPGVSEKVRVALAEIMGIEEDAHNLEGADPLVKAGIEDILNNVRWARKEYGVSGVGLTVGEGTEQDLVTLRDRIQHMQNQAYALVKICPTCNPRIQAAMAKALENRQSGTS